MSLSPPSPTALATAVTEARQQRRNELGPPDDSETTTTPRLHGECVRNAHVLAETLRSHGFDPVVICGGTADKPVSPDGIPRRNLPITIEGCRDTGTIHYWVETTLRTYTLDLAAALPPDHPCQGQPFIARSVPPNYYYLEDGVGHTFNPIPQ